MSKTSQFMMVLHHISQSPNRCLAESRVRELLGNPPRSTWHRQINELTEGTGVVPALLMETIDKESGERFYCVNHRGWQAFIDAHTEGKFLLECYRQVGHLLDSNFANMVFELPDVESRRVEELSRKFLHLVKVKAHKSPHGKFVLDTVIQALITQKQLELTYDGGLRVLRPYTLCQYRDELYVMGDRREGDGPWERRTYKLARINSVRLLEIGFPYPEKRDWNPSEDYFHSSGLILGEVKTVQLRVYGHARKLLAEKDFFNGVLTNTEADCDTYTCTYTSSSEFLGQIFVYAQDIEIVGDEGLRQEFRAKAEQALARNARVELKKA